MYMHIYIYICIYILLSCNHMIFETKPVMEIFHRPHPGGIQHLRRRLLRVLRQPGEASQRDDPGTARVWHGKCYTDTYIAYIYIYIYIYVCISISIYIYILYRYIDISKMNNGINTSTLKRSTSIL